jgi:hypothetical protein
MMRKGRIRRTRSGHGDRTAGAGACATLLFFGTIPVLVGAQPMPSPPPATVSPPRTAQPAPSSSAAQDLNSFAQAWASIAAYSATVTVFERKGTQVENLVLNYSFRRPSSVMAHVVSGPNAGGTLTWDGGATVVARRGTGLAALFKKTFSLHDPGVTTIRGSSIDQLSFGAILAQAQQGGGTLSEAGPDVIDGVATDAVTLVPADPAADAGLTREVVELSAVTHLPVRLLGFEETTLVREIDFSKVAVASV